MSIHSSNVYRAFLLLEITRLAQTNDHSKIVDFTQSTSVKQVMVIVSQAFGAWLSSYWQCIHARAWYIVYIALAP